MSESNLMHIYKKKKFWQRTEKENKISLLQKTSRQTSTSSLYNDLMYVNYLASVNEGTINHCNDGVI